jgi:hypothetical protein
MNGRIPYIDRIDDIREALIAVAQRRETITYSRSAEVLGINPRGPWKPVLDELSRREAGTDRPDITFVLINARTRFPGQIGFQDAHPPSARQRQIADQTQQEVWDYYSASSIRSPTGRVSSRQV